MLKVTWAKQQCTKAKIDGLLHPEGILRLVEPDGKGLHRPKKATNNRHMETPVTISAFMTGMLFTVIRGVRHRRRILARPMAAKVPPRWQSAVESRDTSSVV